MKQVRKIFCRCIAICGAICILTSIAQYSKNTKTVSKTLDLDFNYAKLTVTGDLMVHKWQFDDAYDAESQTLNFDHCLSEISAYLKNSHYTIGNLETTLSGGESGYSFYPLFNAPDEFAMALKNAGFDMLTTANNHSNDKLEQGILRTIQTLDGLGFDHVGTYENRQQRDTPFIKDINGIRFAFLAYTYGTNGILLPDGKDYLVNSLQEDVVVADILKAKTYQPDIIMVFPHMGNEYETEPSLESQRLIYKMLEAGADVVIASHPHVLQPAQFIQITDPDGSVRDCFAAYSAGNFISSQRTRPRDAGFILNLEFEKDLWMKAKLSQVSYIPTWIQFTDNSGNYDIKVHSVYDALNAVENGDPINLKPVDIKRLHKVQAETTATISGTSIPAEFRQAEYVIEKGF